MREFPAKELHVQSHEIVMLHEAFRNTQHEISETSSILVLLLKYEGWKGRK